MPVAVERIALFSAYFDQLVDLIPAKHYLDVEEPVNLKYMKRQEREKTKVTFKQQSKASKRLRLDPDANTSTTTLQQVRAQQPADGAASTSQPVLRAHVFNTASTEALKERLQAKVQAMREQRKADATATAAKEWRRKQHTQSLKAATKRKREDGSEAAAVENSKRASSSTAQDLDVMFNAIHVQDGQERAKRRKKLSKQQLLHDAEAKVQEAQTLDQSQEGKAKLSDESWRKLMKLAQGEKVLDNPQLLKKSLKKEAKLKAKKANAWKERNAASQEKQQARQEKRQKNLQKRSDEKKSRKIAKREKKLMRAGFEGRTARIRT